MNEVQDTLLHNFKYGCRNYTTYTTLQAGKATLFRVSDVLSLKYSDVFYNYDELKKKAHIHDKKTGKPTHCICNQLLVIY
ncbi:hypothetical protein LKI01_01860 [Companilactobacillus paralimentarius]|nr:hypothetical protein LKI01_01860 [Companilactobacillus paralimentarius]